MRITLTSSDSSSEPEVYESLAELKSELEISASEEYTAMVIGRVNTGERHFTVPNGPGVTDTYDIEGQD